MQSTTIQPGLNYCAVHYYTAGALFVVLFYLKRLVFEQVQHCLGGPLHLGPGANYPGCPPPPPPLLAALRLYYVLNALNNQHLQYPAIRRHRTVQYKTHLNKTLTAHELAHQLGEFMTSPVCVHTRANAITTEFCGD